MATINDKRYMNDLEAWVKQVWSLPELEDKKLIALDMLNHMAFKKKIEDFKHKIYNARDGKIIDKLCTDILLSGEGLKVRV